MPSLVPPYPLEYDSPLQKGNLNTMQVPTITMLRFHIRRTNEIAHREYKDAYLLIDIENNSTELPTTSPG